MHSLEPSQFSLPFDDQPAAAKFEVRAPRTRTWLSGKLVYAEGAYTLDCTICNISVTGAKIVISRRQSLPPELYLIAVKYGVAYRANVVWLNYPARGLKFSSAYQLDAIMPKELKFLHQLWTNVSDRPGAWA